MEDSSFKKKEDFYLNWLQHLILFFILSLQFMLSIGNPIFLEFFLSKKLTMLLFQTFSLLNLKNKIKLKYYFKETDFKIGFKQYNMKETLKYRIDLLFLNFRLSKHSQLVFLMGMVDICLQIMPPKKQHHLSILLF